MKNIRIQYLKLEEKLENCLMEVALDYPKYEQTKNCYLYELFYFDTLQQKIIAREEYAEELQKVEQENTALKMENLNIKNENLNIKNKYNNIKTEFKNRMLELEELPNYHQKLKKS